MRWRRSPEPDVRRALGDAPGERLLAWGRLVGGGIVVCTDRAIRFPPDRRVPWDLVVRGAWSEEFLDLVVQPQAGAAADQVRLRFDAPGEVPAVVRERIEWTVVASQRVELTHSDGSVGATMLTARRSPQTGDVRWSVVFEQGIDAADPGWRAAADQALATLREQLGV